MTSSDSELADITTVFISILRTLRNPIHFTELSEHLLLYYAGKKSFFHSYNETEKCSFFKNLSKFFTIDSNGYVTSIENEIIVAFRRFLKGCGSQHFLKLTDAVSVANTYFSQFSNSEKLKFFKDHGQYFSVQNNKYVELSKTDTATREMLFDGQETALLKFLTGSLQSCGPMYLFWLADCLRNSVCYVDAPCLWKFLKEHRHSFIISDDTFVELSPHLKSKVKANSIISQKEDEVIGFFIAKLAVYDCLLYTVLLKMLQNSTLDIKCFFAKYSLKNVRGFFKKHSNVFVLHGKHVSLLSSISLDGYITFNGSKYPVEDVKEVAFFFLYCLKVKCPRHFDDFSVMMLEESNINTDFKYAFLKSPTQFKYIFFEKFQSIFCIGNLSYVSLHSPYEMNGAGQHAVQHFMKELKISSTKNFWTLINSAEVLSEKFQKYFSDFSPLDKFYFFKRNPTIFSINSDGYVSCPVDPIAFSEVEAEVVNILVKQLKKSEPMHFKELCQSAAYNSKVLKLFFQPYLLSQKYSFFENRPNNFSINADGLVSIPSNSDACKLLPKLENTVLRNVSRSDNLLVEETDEEIILISDSELDIQNPNFSGHSAFHSNVKESNAENTAPFSFRGDTVHRKKLCSDVINLTEPENNPELLSRTLNHSKEDVNDSPISMLESSISTSFSCNHLSDADEEMYRRDQVIKSLIGILKSHTQIHFEKLCSYNEHRDEEFVNFFSLYSTQERYNFFKNHSSYFSIDMNGYVSLPGNFQNVNCNSSANNLRLDENTNKCTSTVPSIKNVAEHVENNTVKLQSSNGYIAEEPLQCINSLSCVNSDAKAALNKSSFLSQDPITGLQDLSNANQSFKERHVITMLTHHLHVHKNMHFLKLCKAVKNYFTQHSVSQKYHFFKQNFHHFCIGRNGYVTLPHGTARNCKSNDSFQRIKASVSRISPVLPEDSKIRKNDEVCAILINILYNEKTIHIDKLCSGSSNTVTAYFQSVPANERIQFFRNRTKFSIFPQGYVSLSKDLIISRKRSMSPCTNQISKSNVSTANSICTKDATVNKSNFNVTGDKTFTHQHKRQKLRNRSDSVSNSKMNGNDFATETDSSMRNNIVPLNQQTSNVIQTCKSGINCKGVLGLQKEQSDLMRQRKTYLKSFFLDHEQEIIGKLLDRLRTVMSCDFLELLQSCEEFNSTVNIFFCAFSIDEKLNFFRSYPQYFFVDNNLISISNAMRSSLKTFFFEELVKCTVCSGIHNSTTIQSESVENLLDPGRKGHLASNNEKGLNAAAQVNSPKETIDKTKTGFMDIRQYSASGLLVSHRREVIETLLALLKIGQPLHFFKLCKSAEELNEVCEHFFHFFSSSGRLDFLKSHPQYFLIGNDNFVSLSTMTQSFTSIFLPCTKLSKSNICSGNHIANHQSQDMTSHTDVDTVDHGMASLHSDNSSNSNLLLNSMKGNPCILPLANSSANEVIPLDLNIKELINFYQAILRSTNILHFEELFAKLEDSNKFSNYRTSVKKSSVLEFFEDYPDIFTVHPKGFISLVPEAGAKSTEMRVSSTTCACEEDILFPDSKKISDKHTVEHKHLCLSPDHVLFARYSIKALQESEQVYYKKLAKEVFAKHRDVRIFLMPFHSSDLLDLFKLHSIFIVSDKKIVSLRRSNIIADEALSTEEELRDVKSSLISKTIEFFMSILKSGNILLVKELDNRLQKAPGYVISFINANYPGNKIVDFFKEHPDYFLLDKHGQLRIKYSHIKAFAPMS